MADLMLADLVADAGRILYGDHWQAPLSRALGISERLMRYWMKGADLPTHRNLADICTLLDQRAAQYDAISMRLTRSRHQLIHG